MQYVRCINYLGVFFFWCLCVIGEISLFISCPCNKTKLGDISQSECNSSLRPCLHMCHRRLQHGVQCVWVHRFRSEFLPELAPKTDPKAHRTLLQYGPWPSWTCVNRLTLACHANWMQGKNPHPVCIYVNPALDRSPSVENVTRRQKGTTPTLWISPLPSFSVTIVTSTNREVNAEKKLDRRAGPLPLLFKTKKRKGFD